MCGAFFNPSLERAMASYITTVDKVKTIIPHQAVVEYLVKDWIFEEKIANVTIFMEAFLDTQYNTGYAAVASLLGIDLKTKHVGIQNISDVFFIAGTGYEYGSSGPIEMTVDIDYSFNLTDTILDEIYKLSSYMLGFSREFAEQTVYGGNFELISDFGYLQYKVVGGNDTGGIYNMSVELQADKPFFMDNVAQLLLIDSAMSGEGELSPIIQLLAAYIVAKDIITEYILPVFKEDKATNLAGVRLDVENLLPGFEEFLEGLDDKIADIWALLKYKGKVVVNPDGPDGPDPDGPWANIARTVVRGERVRDLKTPYADADYYLRTGVGYEDRDLNL